MRSHESYPDRLQAAMLRGLAASRRMSVAQVELAGMRVLQRLKREPAWQSSAPLAADALSRANPRSRKAVAAAAAVGLAAGTGVLLMMSWGPRSADATVEVVDGSLYSVSDGQPRELTVTGRIAFGDIVRSNSGRSGTFVLTDGSRVEMRSQSELSLERATDGVRIRLNRGDIIVNAAKRRDGHLYVQTKDVIVSVVGTVFLVNVEDEGSRVAVIEGQVRVTQGASEKELLPGEQVVTNPVLVPPPVIEAIAWSRNAESHLALLQQSGMGRPAQSQNIVGDYIGAFGGSGVPEVTAKLHIKADADGKLSATLEFPDQGRVVSLTDVRVEGRSLSFAVPSLDDRWNDSFGDSWKGSIENDGALLNGAFTKKLSMQLLFARDIAQTEIRPTAAQTPTRPETAQIQPRPDASLKAVRPADIPKWEVVSIRPCPGRADGGGGGARGGRGGAGAGPYRFSADRMTLNCLTVRSLIRSAYHVYLDAPRPGATPLDSVLIRGIGEDRRDWMDGTDGGPDWVDADLFTIEAKAEGVTDRALMQGPMLQAILEDRFKIKVHRETRDTALDALVIAKGGPNLKPFVEGSCVRRPGGYRSTPLLPTQGRQRYCRTDGDSLNLNNNAVNIVYHAEGFTIDEFVKLFLNGYRGRFVIDKTGLTGRFDIRVESEISAETRQRIGDLAGIAIGPSTAPPLPEALQQQLGLKLESTKGQVEFLVIDHIERPSPN